MSQSPAKPSCFKAYDIRGRVPEDLNEDLAYRIGLATVLLGLTILAVAGGVVWALLREGGETPAPAVSAVLARQILSPRPLPVVTTLHEGQPVIDALQKFQHHCRQCPLLSAPIFLPDRSLSIP